MSVRALTIGVILAVVLNLAAPYAGLVMNSQFLDTSYFPIGLGISFFVILLGANCLLRLVRRPLGRGVLPLPARVGSDGRRACAPVVLRRASRGRSDPLGSVAHAGGVVGGIPGNRVVCGLLYHRYSSATVDGE